MVDVLDTLGDLGEGAVKLLPPVLKGESPAQQRIAEGFRTRGPLGGLFNALGQAPALAVESALQLADIAGVPAGIGAVTGRDPYTGQHLTGGQRALSALGLLPIAAAGTGLAYHRFRTGELQFLDETGAVRLPGAEFEPRRTDTFAGPGGPSRYVHPYEPRVQRSLTARNWDGLVTAVNELDDQAKAPIVAGFMSSLGRRLTSESPLHGEGAMGATSPEVGALNAAAWEISKFDTAVRRGLLEGAGAAEFAGLYERMLRGELGLEDAARLQDFMVEFARATEFADPNLAVSPGVRFFAFDADPHAGIVPYYEVDTLPRSARTVDWWAWTPKITQNYLRLYEMATPDDLAQAQWYLEQHGVLKATAEDAGLTIEHGAAAAAITSPNSPWPQNLQAAQDIMRTGETEATVYPALKERAAEAMGSSAPLHEFLFDLTEGQKRAYRRWEAKGFMGGVPSELRVMAQKTPSFGHNLWKPLTSYAATIDVHMFNAGSGYSAKVIHGLSKPPIDVHKNYQAFEAALRQAAVESGFNPADQRPFLQFQSVVWHVWKRLTNDGRDPYVLDPAVMDFLEGNGPSALRQIVPDVIAKSGDRIVDTESPSFPGKPPRLTATPDDVPVLAERGGQPFLYGSLKKNVRQLLRGMRPAQFDDGVGGGDLHAYVPAAPTLVRSAQEFTDALFKGSRHVEGTQVTDLQGGTGWRIYSAAPASKLPAFGRGNQIIINALEDIEDSGVELGYGNTRRQPGAIDGPRLKRKGFEAHDELIAELELMGVKPQATVLEPHVGYSTAWELEDGELTWTPAPEVRTTRPTKVVPERRQAMVLDFGDDRAAFDKAWDHLHRGVFEAGDRDQLHPLELEDWDGEIKQMNTQRRIYGEQILDMVGYTEHGREPYGHLKAQGKDGNATTRAALVPEYHWVDEAGNRLVHLNTVEDRMAPNVVYAWVTPEFRGYFEGSASVRLSSNQGAGKVDRIMTANPDGSVVYDGQLLIRPVGPHKVWADPKRVLESKVDTKGIGEFQLELPEGALPTMYVGDIENFFGDPTNTVRVTVKGKSQVTVHMDPIAGTAYNLSLFDRAVQALRAVGYRGKTLMKPTTAEASEAVQ